MALLSLAQYKSVAGVTGTDATRDAALTSIIAGVCAAFVRLANGNVLEGPATYTELYDAPWNVNTITLRQGPVNSITSVHVRFDAKGDTSLFTSDYLKTQYTDYVLDIDRSDGKSWGKKLRCLTHPNWGGFWQERPAWGGLTAKRTDAPKAIKVVYSAGIVVPDDVVMALSWAVSVLYKQREFGAPITSGSWNGESVSFAGQHTATSALLAPNVMDVLRHYYARSFSFA